MNKHRVFASLAFILLAMPTVASTAIIQVESGTLVGAQNVEVGGVLYDVTLVDGSCASVFAECGAPTVIGFAFTTDAAANTASLALFDQVFVPVYFFGNPVVDSIVGCSNWLDCLIVTAFATSDGDVFGRAVVLTNSPATVISNAPFSRGTGETADNWVFAVWSRVGDTTQVPEPGSLALLGLGLLGIGLRRRIKAS